MPHSGDLFSPHIRASFGDCGADTVAPFFDADACAQDLASSAHDSYVRDGDGILSGAVLPEHRGIHHALGAACSAVGLSLQSDGALEGAPEGASERALEIGGDGDRLSSAKGCSFQLEQRLMDLPDAERVCVIFIDGMGAYQLRERLGHIPAMRRLGIDDDNAMITTIAPSTTAAALTAFSTGLLPGQTAMLSYALRYGDKQQLFNLIQFKDAPIAAEEWQIQATIFERLGQSAARTMLIEDPAYKDSGLTFAAWRGAPARFAKRLDQRVNLALEELHAGRSLVYLYWGNLDHCGHAHGLDSSAWLSELEMVDAAVKEVVSRAPRNTLVIVTADHGMVEDTQKIDIAHTPELDKGVRAVAGEERATHLYTDEPDELAERWQNYLGSEAWIMTQTDIERSGLFGQLTDRSRAAMGDVVAFARKQTGFVDSRILSEHALALRGVHGSLTPAEMYVPWLIHLT